MNQGPYQIAMQLLIPVMMAAISALTAWMFTIDERVFNLSSRVATRDDVVRIERRIEEVLQVIQQGQIKGVRDDLDNERRTSKK